MKHIRSVLAGVVAIPLALSLGAWTVPGSSSSSADLSSSGESPQAVDPADNLPETFDLQSHRFGRGEWTEESELGVIESQKLDVTTLEFDIVISEDGVPVVWHDPTIQADKCTDAQTPLIQGDPEYPYVGKLVNDLTWEQLQTLNCNLPLDAYPDAEHPETNRLLQLRDVFELTKDDTGVHYNIETKVEADNPDASATPQEFVDAILPVIEEYDVADRTMIQSFDWRTLPLVREQAPEIPLVMLWSNGTWHSGSAFTGEVDYDEVNGDIFAAADQIGVEILSPGHTSYGRDDNGDFDLEAARQFNTEANERGYRVVPWTVNDGSEMREQLEAGVDGIITDYPSRLKAILDEQGIDF